MKKKRGQVRAQSMEDMSLNGGVGRGVWSGSGFGEDGWIDEPCPTFNPSRKMEWIGLV